MANQKSFFFTGANAKIRLNGRTIAFATNISYRITVKHGSPRVLGRFEVENHIPLMYDVEGSFTIIKYAKGLSDLVDSPSDVSGRGSGAGSWGRDDGVGGAIGGAIGLPTTGGQFDGKADEAFVPSRLFQAKAFDIDIIQKANIKGGEEECMIAKLEGCRITEEEFQISKRSVAMQTFRFKARYAHEDTFNARKSGVGQELS